MKPATSELDPNTQEPAPQANPTVVPTTGVTATTSDHADVVATETGGRKGPDPTRYGDWEKNGRCIDF